MPKILLFDQELILFYYRLEMDQYSQNFEYINKLSLTHKYN